MIVHLDVKIKKKCIKCGGTGEILKDREFSTTDKRFITHICSNCDGNGYTWKKRTINTNQLKGLLDEK